MIRPALHIVLHFIVPALAARCFFKDRRLRAWLIMVATIIVDVDHLLAQPIYDPNRCSIGFHPLHTYPAIGVYVLALLVPRLRLVAVGLLIHMGLDLSDCWCVYSGI